MDQRDLFDIPRGERLKREGMDAAAEARAEALDVAQAIAIRLGQQSNGEGITADEVYWIMVQERPDLVPMLGNAAGSIFRGSYWRTYGKFVESNRASRHRNAIRVWYYDPRG